MDEDAADKGPERSMRNVPHMWLDASILLATWAAGYYGSSGGVGAKSVIMVGVAAMLMSVLDSSKLQKGLKDYAESFARANRRSNKKSLFGKVFHSAHGKQVDLTEDWFNYTIAETWGTTVEPMLTDSVTATLEALLEQNKPGVLSKLCAKTVSFGKKPPMISDIRPFDDGQQHTGPRVMLEANFVLETEGMDLSIVAMLSKYIPITVSVYQCSISGVVRLSAKPVCGAPYAGKVRVSFAQKPVIDLKIRTTGAGNLSALPAIDGWIDNVAMSMVGSMMVEPNGFELDLEEPVQVSKEEIAGIGTLHVRILEATNLKAKSVFGTLDPYVEADYNGEKHVVPKVNRTSNPKWNRTLMFNVHDGEKHRLTFRALDWEKGPAVDEVLGECFMELDLASMAQKKRTVVTLPLGADKNSTLRVMIIWTGSAGTVGAVDNAAGQQAVVTTPAEGVTVFAAPQRLGSRSQGTLFVTVHSAKELILCDRISKSSDPYVEIELDGEKRETRVINNSQNPEWNETLEFEVKLDSKLQLQATCYDRNRLRKKGYLGNVTLALPALMDGQAHKMFHKLGGVASGELRLVIVYSEHDLKPSTA